MNKEVNRIHGSKSAKDPENSPFKPDQTTYSSSCMKSGYLKEQ